MQADHANFSVLFALAALVLIWATSLLTQHLVMRLVRRMMMAPSDDLDAVATAGEAVQATPASRSLEWVVLTAKSTLTDATATREAVVAQAQDEFKSALKHDLSIAAAYVIIPMAVYAWPGPTSWDGSFLSFLIGLLAVLTLPFVSVMRYLAFRQQFRAYQSGLAGIFRPFATTWLEICKPKWRGLIAGIVITMALLNVYWGIVDGSWRTALGYSAAIAVHVYLLYRLMTMARRAPNLKLLVLRVFGFDDAAQFTFEGLLQYWCHFGTFFTVVDPSFIRSQYRQRNRLIGVLAMTAVTLLGVLSSVENPQRLALLAVLPVLLLGAAVYIYASLRLTERQFLRSESDLAKRMSRLDEWPRGLALTFKSMPMMCHDNVWKSAVALSANVCAAVLMDLRGFSDERKGCQYEVDFLLDQVPADRIVFLIDPQDAERVQALILESWNALKITSPNLTRAAPRIALYVASDQDDKDIQGILDQLLHAARAEAPRGAGARQSTADAAMQGGPRRAAESAHALTPMAGSAESGT